LNISRYQGEKYDANDHSVNRAAGQKHQIKENFFHIICQKRQNWS
jgi:hypothetical protein